VYDPCICTPLYTSAHYRPKERRSGSWHKKHSYACVYTCIIIVIVVRKKEKKEKEEEETTIWL
jgi:hypothetical protein